MYVLHLNGLALLPPWDENLAMRISLLDNAEPTLRKSRERGKVLEIRDGQRYGDRNNECLQRRN